MTCDEFSMIFLNFLNSYAFHGLIGEIFYGSSEKFISKENSTY